MDSYSLSVVVSDGSSLVGVMDAGCLLRGSQGLKIFFFFFQSVMDVADTPVFLPVLHFVILI